MPTELLLIFFITSIQLVVFISTFSKIKKISYLFPDTNTLNIVTTNNTNVTEQKKKIKESHSIIHPYETISITIDDANIKVNDGFKSIVNSTNEYLKNNRGSAADFNIIRDVTERINTAYEDSIQATISIPLYIGLLGTMFGIIYGIYNIKMPLDDASLFTLLDGVKLAMIASFVGLFLTLINSSVFFKNACFKRDFNKNNYYTFIQTNLLPILTKDMASSLSNIHSQLAIFNSEFFQNIQLLKSSLEMVGSNIQIQKDVIDKLDKIKIQEIAKINLQVLDKLTESSKSFDVFISYQTNLNILFEKFSINFTIGHELIDKIISARGEVNEILLGIKETINTNKNTSEFLKLNFNKLNSISDTTKDIVTQQEISLRDLKSGFIQVMENTGKSLTDSYKDNIDDLQKSLNSTNSIFHQELEHFVENSKNRLKEISSSIESSINKFDFGNINLSDLSNNNKILTDIKDSIYKSFDINYLNTKLLESLLEEARTMNHYNNSSLFSKIKLLFTRKKV